jgi:hypothetical protein
LPGPARTLEGFRGLSRTAGAGQGEILSEFQRLSRQLTEPPLSRGL